MKFLETINLFGDDILIPIDSIQFISYRYVTDWVIHIKGNNDIDLEEHFGKDEESARERYNMIKKIIEGE